jgi:hypothetical protein
VKTRAQDKRPAINDSPAVANATTTPPRATALRPSWDHAHVYNPNDEVHRGLAARIFSTLAPAAALDAKTAKMFVDTALVTWKAGKSVHLDAIQAGRESIDHMRNYHFETHCVIIARCMERGVRIGNNSKLTIPIVNGMHLISGEIKRLTNCRSRLLTTDQKLLIATLQTAHNNTIQ